jgi:hypothetical protein
MTDFPILQRTRAELIRRLAGMHRNDPRRGEVERALRDATRRLMRAQLRSQPRVEAPSVVPDLFALIARGPAAPHQEHVP